MAPKRQGFASLDELFAAVRARCAEEYEEQHGRAWAGLDDWPQWKTVSPFERRAREVYEQLAVAVEASRKLIEEQERVAEECFARELDAVALSRATPPDTSSTVTKLAEWVGAADQAAEARAGSLKTDLGIDFMKNISNRPWIDSTPVDPRFLVTMHVLTLARFGLLPNREDGSDEKLHLGPLEIASDRKAAVVSLLFGNRPSSATPEWTVAKVIGNEAATMRNRLLRTVPRVVDRLLEIVGEGVTKAKGEPRSLEDAMIFALAFSKMAEVGASAFRLAEAFHPDDAKRLRDTNPGLERMLDLARWADPKGHKQSR